MRLIIEAASRMSKRVRRQLKQRSWPWWIGKIGALLTWGSRLPKAGLCWPKFSRYWCHNRPQAGLRDNWSVAAAQGADLNIALTNTGTSPPQIASDFDGHNSGHAAARTSLASHVAP